MSGNRFDPPVLREVIFMKTAAIMLGGGMHSSHTFGAICALANELNFKEPEIFIAASGRGRRRRILRFGAI